MQTLAFSVEINLYSEEIALSVNYLSYLITIRTWKSMNMYIHHTHMCTPDYSHRHIPPPSIHSLFLELWNLQCSFTCRTLLQLPAKWWHMYFILEKWSEPFKVAQGVKSWGRSHIQIVCMTLILKETSMLSATQESSIEYWLPMVTNHRQKARAPLVFTGVCSILSMDLKTNLFMLNEGLEQRPHCKYPPSKTLE